MANRVCQFKITLKDIDPPIWRRILVPEKFNFWELHVAIHDAMGWLNYHLHTFYVRSCDSNIFKEINIPSDNEYDADNEFILSWDVQIFRYLRESGDICIYEYDFGACWEHEIIFEGFLMRESGKEYPFCLEGERACPPEDCGGVIGYQLLMEVLSDTSHEEYDEKISWLGKKFDTEEFYPEKVIFHDPKNRFKRACPEGY